MLLLQPMAASGGALLASGAAHGRAAAGVIGSCALLAALPLLVFSFLVAWRVWRGRDLLGLSYLAQSPPPPYTMREGLLPCLLRVSKVRTSHGCLPA